MANKIRKRRIVVALWMINMSGREILSGIFRYAKTRIGWDIRLIQLPNATHPERIRKLASKEIDGIITSDFCNATLKKILAGTMSPVVFIGSPNIVIPRPRYSKTSSKPARTGIPRDTCRCRKTMQHIHVADST